MLLCQRCLCLSEKSDIGGDGVEGSESESPYDFKVLFSIHSNTCFLLNVTFCIFYDGSVFLSLEVSTFPEDFAVISQLSKLVEVHPR